MKSKFRIRICSDLDYEEMVADLCYGDYKLATITQEEGLNNMEIEIFSPSEKNKLWKLPLDDFVESMLLAKKRLIEMQKPSEDNFG